MAKTKSKAVLVLNEMPKRCEECWLANFEKTYCYCYCMAMQDAIGYDEANYEEINAAKGDWRWNKCPLRKLPRPINFKHRGGTITEDYANGFNDCLALIIGTED